MKAKIIHVSTDEQLAHCLHIRKKVFVEEQQVPIELEIDKYDVLSPDVHHLLIEVEEQFVATGRLIYYNDNCAKMQRIAVLSSFRSQGIGRILLIAMEELARELALDKSVLDAQIQAQQFYHLLGYKVVSSEPFDDAGIMHVRMEKELS